MITETVDELISRIEVLGQRCQSLEKENRNLKLQLWCSHIRDPMTRICKRCGQEESPEYKRKDNLLPKMDNDQ